MKYDYICIGGGSGGIASANRAAMHGAKVALIEGKDLGGTCVNVGCVPKKVMWYAAQIAEAMRYAKDYGFPCDASQSVANMDWDRLISNRQAYIRRIHQSYDKILTSNKVDVIRGYGQFIKPDEVLVHMYEDGEEEI